MKKKKLAGLRLAVIALAMRLLDRHLIHRINFEPLKIWLSAQLKLVNDVVDKLTDKDPDNKAQLAAVWEEHKTTLVDNSLDATKASIAVLVKNPLLAEEICLLLDAAIDEDYDDYAVVAS